MSDNLMERMAQAGSAEEMENILEADLKNVVAEIAGVNTALEQMAQMKQIAQGTPTDGALEPIVQMLQQHKSDLEDYHARTVTMIAAHRQKRAEFAAARALARENELRAEMGMNLVPKAARSYLH